MHYFEEAQNIWKTFVPKRGQAETVQGELLRAVEKLRDESTRNGNINWDDGFGIFLTYIENHLTDQAVYSPESIAATRTALNRLRDYDHPYLEDDLYDQLGDRVVEYFRFHGSLPHANNQNLHR